MMQKRAICPVWIKRFNTPLMNNFQSLLSSDTYQFCVISVYMTHRITSSSVTIFLPEKLPYKMAIAAYTTIYIYLSLSNFFSRCKEWSVQMHTFL